jgi:hypothetical protein
MTEKRTTLGKILTWTILGLLALFALKLAVRLIGVVFGMAGMLFGLVGFLLFTVGPVIFVGWLAVKAWQAFTHPSPTP